MEWKLDLNVVLNNGKIEIAKKLLEEGKNVEYIAELTGLEENEIKELTEENL